MSMIARVVDRGRVRVDGGVFELMASVPPCRERQAACESLRVASLARSSGVTDTRGQRSASVQVRQWGRCGGDQESKKKVKKEAKGNEEEDKGGGMEERETPMG